MRLIATWCVCMAIFWMAGSACVYAEDLININTASTEELKQISGIGDIIADRIVEYRESNGPFENAEDIKGVKGIGEKMYDKMKNQIIVAQLNK